MPTTDEQAAPPRSIWVHPWFETGRFSLRPEQDHIEYVPAARVAEARAEVWELAIATAMQAYVYGPSNITLERDGAIQARTIIIAALEAAQGK